MSCFDETRKVTGRWRADISMRSFFWGSRVGVDSGGNADDKPTLGFASVMTVSPPSSTMKSNMLP